MQNTRCYSFMPILLKDKPQPINMGITKKIIRNAWAVIVYN